MPAILTFDFWLPYLIKYGVPLAVTLLEKVGKISGLDATLVKAGTHVLVAVENVKTYHENNQLDPKQSDFPAETGRDNMP